MPALFAAGLVLGACDGGERPRIALATNLEFADAATLAVDDALAAWGELPADTVIALEGRTRAVVAIETASELVRMEGLVAVVGHSNSAASLAAAPVYNEHEIVQLSPQSSAAAYSDAGPFSFRLVPPDDRQGRFIVDALLAMPGVERIVVLYVNDDYGRGLRSSLLAVLGAGGPELVGEAPHLEGETMRVEDVELARQVLEETRPDAIVWLGRPLILDHFLPEILPVIGDAPIIGSDALALATRYEADPHWNGVRFVDFVDLTATEAGRDFARRYRDRFGRPATSPDALTYDAVMLLLHAARDGASTGPEMRDWLESLGNSRPAHVGVTGLIRFDADGDVARSYMLRRIETPAQADR